MKPDLHLYVNSDPTLPRIEVLEANAVAELARRAHPSTLAPFLAGAEMYALAQPSGDDEDREDSLNGDVTGIWTSPEGPAGEPDLIPAGSPAPADLDANLATIDGWTGPAKFLSYLRDKGVLAEAARVHDAMKAGELGDPVTAEEADRRCQAILNAKTERSRVAHPSTIAPTPGELAAVLAYEYNDLLNLAGIAVKAEVADEMMACTDSYVVLRHLSAVRAVADRIGVAS